MLYYTLKWGSCSVVGSRTSESLHSHAPSFLLQVTLIPTQAELVRDSDYFLTHLYRCELRVWVSSRAETVA